MKGMIDMRKKMKIGPRVAIITSAMILAGSMAACGNTKDTDNKITTATVTDASVMNGAENTSEDAADEKTSKKKDDVSTKDQTTSTKTTTEDKADSKKDDNTSTTESKPATTQAAGNKPSSEKPSTTQAPSSKPSTTESKPTTTQAPSNTKPSTTESKPATTQHQTTQTTTEAAKDHSWVYSWKEKKENVKIADEWSYPEYAAANHCRACGQDSLASTWDGQRCPICQHSGDYGSAPDMPTGNTITEPAIYQEQVVGYTCTIKCSRCGETRTFECDANKNGNINTSGKCK